METSDNRGRIGVLWSEAGLREPTPITRRSGYERGCKGVKLLKFPLITDPRGNLVFGEFPNHLPFQPVRFFMTYGVPDGSNRGGHGHRKLEQLIICAKGSMVVSVDDGSVRDEYLLDSPGIGLYIPPFVWGAQFGHSMDCVMLVLASDVYEEGEYIRDYSEFLECVKANEDYLL